jgi:hypothetical protein
VRGLSVSKGSGRSLMSAVEAQKKKGDPSQGPGMVIYSEFKCFCRYSEVLTPKIFMFDDIWELTFREKYIFTY